MLTWGPRMRELGRGALLSVLLLLASAPLAAQGAPPGDGGMDGSPSYCPGGWVLDPILGQCVAPPCPDPWGCVPPVAPPDPQPPPSGGPPSQGGPEPQEEAPTLANPCEAQETAVDDALRAVKEHCGLNRETIPCATATYNLAVALDALDFCRDLNR